MLYVYHSSSSFSTARGVASLLCSRLSNRPKFLRTFETTLQCPRVYTNAADCGFWADRRAGVSHPVMMGLRAAHVPRRCDSVQGHPRCLRASRLERSSGFFRSLLVFGAGRDKLPASETRLSGLCAMITHREILVE